MPETTRLAKTIQAWWPAILAALTNDVSNARTERFNRVIKQAKRAGCGYRSMNNYQRRIPSHIAVTRPQDQQHERDQPRSNSKSRLSHVLELEAPAHGPYRLAASTAV